MNRDQQAIEAVLGKLYQGFAQRDADLLQEVYAKDADWTNAFGHTITGSEAIVAYLCELFADPNFSEGEITKAPEISVREVGEGAVAVKVYTEIEGQKTIDGGTLPTRRNFSLKLLGRQSDGSWRVVSEMYMDARNEVSHVQT